MNSRVDKVINGFLYGIGVCLGMYVFIYTQPFLTGSFVINLLQTTFQLIMQGILTGFGATISLILFINNVQPRFTVNINTAHSCQSPPKTD